MEFFILILYMYSINYCVWYLNNFRKCKFRYFFECVIGGWLIWNFFLVFFVLFDVDWFCFSFFCVNGVCLLCKFWKWIFFVIGRILLIDNMFFFILLCMKCINCYDNLDGYRCDFIYWIWSWGLDLLWLL